MSKAASLSIISASKPLWRSHLFASIACVLFMSTLPFSALHAQNARRMPEGKSPDQTIAEMKSRLGLTEDQEAQIRPILEDESVKRHAIIERYQGQGRQGRSSLRNELQQLRASTEHRFESILTKAQMEEYRKMQEEARQRMRQGGPGSTRPH
jgi:Spy/CpxP family protein refolding chaperone